jgi:hypothetical protein
MDDAELEAWATEVRDRHDPANQEHNYDRCQICGFTRFPCDTYELADEVLRLLNELEWRDGRIQRLQRGIRLDESERNRST